MAENSVIGRLYDNIPKNFPLVGPKIIWAGVFLSIGPKNENKRKEKWRSTTHTSLSFSHIFPYQIFELYNLIFIKQNSKRIIIIPIKMKPAMSTAMKINIFVLVHNLKIKPNMIKKITKGGKYFIVFGADFVFI